MNGAYRQVLWLIGDHIKVKGEPGYTEFYGVIVALGTRFGKAVIRDDAGELHVVHTINLHPSEG